MAEVYIIQNQDKQLLGKQRNWLDGTEPAALYRTVHKDEAVNEMFEATSRDYSQRAHILSCPTNAKGVPVVEQLPAPEAKSQHLPVDDTEPQAL